MWGSIQLFTSISSVQLFTITYTCMHKYWRSMISQDVNLLWYSWCIRYVKKNVSLWLLCGVQHWSQLTFSCLKAQQLLFGISTLHTFKGFWRTIEINFEQGSFYVSYKLLSSCWSVELKLVFYYVPHPLINQAPSNDIASLTLRALMSHICDISPLRGSPSVPGYTKLSKCL